MASTRSRATRATFALATAALLAGCVGYPVGGYGSPDGYGRYPDSGYGMQSVSGVVQGYDRSSGRLVLSTDAGGYGGRSVEVWVDRGTRLFYQGREQDPSGLEPGDGVRIDVQDDGRRLWARTIEVTRNVRDGGGYPGGYGGAFEAAVRYVDLNRRLIEVTRGGYSGRVEQVWFDERTRFEYRGQRVDARQLRPGDLVLIDARPAGNGWHADVVRVTVDARSR